MLRLRPHHALCMNHFRGKGYSAAFTRRMTDDVALDGETEVEIVFGCDDLCAVCPNRRKDRCLSQQKVERYDKETALQCGFREHEHLTLGEFRKRGMERVILGGVMPCADCQWADICIPLTEKARETAPKR